MEKKYSIVIHPSQAIIDSIKEMKEFLALKVGWFNSKNSVAHITICEFIIEESQIDKFKQKLLKICNTFTPFQVYLDHFGFYENSGAFFIGLSEDTEIKSKPIIKKTQKKLPTVNTIKSKPKQTSNLKSIMKKTQDALQLSNLKKSNDPHISIGRRLTPENLKIASEIFTTIDMNFLCDNIVLREFDPIKKQFFVIDTFSFGSNPQPELIQGSLF